MLKSSNFLSGCLSTLSYTKIKCLSFEISSFTFLYYNLLTGYLRTLSCTKIKYFSNGVFSYISLCYNDVLSTSGGKKDGSPLNCICTCWTRLEADVGDSCSFVNSISHGTQSTSCRESSLALTSGTKAQIDSSIIVDNLFAFFIIAECLPQRMQQLKPLLAEGNQRR